jgi:replicative DNA helicase
MSHDRLPPHSIEAEQALLGSILLGGPMDEIMDVVPVEAFYDLRHQEVYGALRQLFAESKPMNTVSLYEHLKAAAIVDRCGGLAYVSSLPDTSPSGQNAQYYVEVIMGHYARRKAIQASTGIIDLAFNDGLIKTPDFIDRVEKSIMGIGSHLHTKAERTIKELVRGAIDTIEEWHSNKGSVAGLKTGYTDLDRMTMGLKAGNMIVVAGRPAVGKTTLALNIMDYIAVDLQQPSGLFSLEMTDAELVLRVLCSRGRVVLKNIEEGFLAERDFPKLIGAAGKLSNAPIYIDDTPGLSILQIRSRARRWKQRHGIKFLVIDYLQLVHAVEHRDKREREVAEVSLGIKELAKELSIPVLVLSQLNRSSEREGRKPMLSDLRESGAIEQDADLVAFLYKDPGDDDDPDSDVIPVKLRIEKQRSGPTGQINLVFFRSISRFETASKVDESDMPATRQGDNIP